MAVTYTKLWKLLLDKKMKRTDLKNIAGISSSTLAKLGKDEYVSLESIEKIRLTNNTIHSISKSSNIRMGLSYAKESHAEFFNRFSICQDRIKDLFEIEKGTSITEAQAIEGNIPVVAGGKDLITSLLSLVSVSNYILHNFVNFRSEI